MAKFQMILHKPKIGRAALQKTQRKSKKMKTGVTQSVILHKSKLCTEMTQIQSKVSIGYN